ncbi:hypothetical protein SAMN04487787_106103 [Kosakonia sacchari]|nr:hypothetical protein SAMN04487787_106103 [Kosakonia sacchari]
MHMFNSPSDAQLYEKNVQKAVNNLLVTFKGGDYKQALAVLDWMKDVLADHASIVGPTDNDSFSCSDSPSFPLKFLKIAE